MASLSFVSSNILIVITEGICFFLMRRCPVTGQTEFNLPAEKLPALLNSLHIKKLNLFE